MSKETEGVPLSSAPIEKEYKLLKKRTKVILYVLLVLLTEVMLFAGYQAFINTSDVPRNRDISRYKDILTEDEQAEWKSRDIQTGEAVFQLNLKIPVDVQTSNAEIRLVHPPYSDFICKVSLRDVESDILLYESERMIPGTLIQYITLSETMAMGEYDAIVEYTFFDGKNKIHGTYDVEVELDVKEQGAEESVINHYHELEIENQEDSSESTQ
jgi:hypothetical protein